MDRKKYLAELKNANIEDLYLILLELRHALDKAFAEQHHRHLPFADVLFDRWERAEQLGFGNKTSIYDSSLVLGDVTVGQNTWIGPNTLLDGSGGLEIGDNCSISAGVQIYSHDSVQWAISGGQSKYEYARTVIGNNCYIGPNVIISRGVELGEGCIVGANSFVNKSFGKFTKIAGTPAREIVNEQK